MYKVKTFSQLFMIFVHERKKQTKFSKELEIWYILLSILCQRSSYASILQSRTWSVTTTSPTVFRWGSEFSPEALEIHPNTTGNRVFQQKRFRRLLVASGGFRWILLFCKIFTPEDKLQVIYQRNVLRRLEIPPELFPLLRWEGLYYILGGSRMYWPKSSLNFPSRSNWFTWPI